MDRYPLGKGWDDTDEPRKETRMGEEGGPNAREVKQLGRCCVPSPSRAAVAVPFGLISIHTGRSVPSWITSTNSIALRSIASTNSSQFLQEEFPNATWPKRWETGKTGLLLRPSPAVHAGEEDASRKFTEPLVLLSRRCDGPHRRPRGCRHHPISPRSNSQAGQCATVVDIFQKKCKKFKSRANQDMRRKIGLGRADPVHEIAKMDHSIDRGSAGKNQGAGGP